MSFGSLLNDVRRDLALRYLSGSTHSVSSIAQMTGYAAPSSFTRWFCIEFGTAPAAWRAEGRQIAPIAICRISARNADFDRPRHLSRDARCS